MDTKMNSTMKKESNKLYNKIFFWVFGIGYLAMILLNIATPKKEYSETEKRQLAKIPEFSVADLLDGDYARGLESWANDHFIFRDDWIKMKVTNEKMLGKTDSNGVYFCDDGYLIEQHKEEAFDAERMEKNKTFLKRFVDKFDDKLNINVVMIPTASEILTDKLPPFTTTFNQIKYNNEVKEIVGSGNYIDVSETLKEHSDEYIYYKTDHHWTTLGAYYAYEEWARANGIEALSQDAFEIEKATDNFLGTLHNKVNIDMEADEMYIYKIKENMDYKVTINMGSHVDQLYNYKALETKDKYEVYMYGNNGLIEVSTNVTNGKKLLVIKDSYSHSFNPFVINHYEETHIIDFRYFNANLSKYIEENGITDVLIMYNTINFVKDTNLVKFIG